MFTNKQRALIAQAMCGVGAIIAMSAGRATDVCIFLAAAAIIYGLSE